MTTDDAQGIDPVTGRIDMTNRPPHQPIRRGKNWKRAMQIDAQTSRVERSFPMRRALNMREPAR